MNRGHKKALALCAYAMLTVWAVALAVVKTEGSWGANWVYQWWFTPGVLTAIVLFIAGIVVVEFLFDMPPDGDAVEERG
jgi:predicted membrane protein